MIILTRNITKQFSNIYLTLIVMVSLSPIAYWMISKKLAYLPKVAFFLMIFLMFIVLIKDRFILNDWLVKYLTFYGALLIIYGLVMNPIARPTVAHIQTLILPIMGISFGFLIAKKYSFVLDIFYKKMPYIAVILSCIIIFYFIAHKLGYIPYFGASSLIIIPIAWALLEKKYTIMTFLLFMMLLTGKRASLLAFFIIFTIYLYKKSKFIVISFLGAFFIFLYFYGRDIDMLYRFIKIYDSLISTEFNLELLNSATSGRITDLIAAYNSINESWIYWIYGKGIGATFTVPHSAYLWTTHYSHFTPLSYIFLGGLLLFIPIYIKLINLLIYSINHVDNFFNILFINYFLIALIGGAILFSDPFVWIIVGILIYNKHAQAINLKMTNS